MQQIFWPESFWEYLYPDYESTTDVFEKRIAALYGGAGALAVSSRACSTIYFYN